MMIKKLLVFSWILLLLLVVWKVTLEKPIRLSSTAIWVFVQLHRSAEEEKQTTKLSEATSKALSEGIGIAQMLI